MASSGRVQDSFEVSPARNDEEPFVGVPARVLAEKSAHAELDTLSFEEEEEELEEEDDEESEASIPCASSALALDGGRVPSMCA